METRATHHAPVSRSAFTTRRGAVLAAFALTALYAVTRLVWLDRFPIFCDEATYLGWVDQALGNRALAYVSLADGKQPLFIWLIMLMRNVVDDPLRAGRLVSVAAGFAAMIGTGVLAGHLFRDRRMGWVAALLYVLTPLFIFHDRLALYDALTAAFCVWGLVLVVILARGVRTDAALGLGLVAGAGVLTKSSAFFALAWLPLGLLLFRWRPFSARRLAAWLGLALLATGIALAIYSLLRLTPWFAVIDVKNHAFVYSLAEWWQAPLFLVKLNFLALGPRLLVYLTPPLLLAALIGCLWGRRDFAARLLLLAAFAMPFCYLVCVGKWLHTRYLVFMAPPLIALAAFALVRLGERLRAPRLRVAVIALLLAYPAVFSVLIAVAPRSAPLFALDQRRYLEDYPSGTGVVELRAHLRAEAARGPLLVVTDGDFGLFPMSLALFLRDQPNLAFKGRRDLHEAAVWEDVRKLAAGRTCLVVVHRPDRQALATTEQWPIEQVWEFDRGRGDSFLRLYRLKSANPTPPKQP